MLFIQVPGSRLFLGYPLYDFVEKYFRHTINEENACNSSFKKSEEEKTMRKTVQKSSNSNNPNKMVYFHVRMVY